jgi:hypothetical protein
MAKVTGRSRDPFDISELEGFALELYTSLKDYVTMSKSSLTEEQIDLELLTKILRLDNESAREIWREIQRLCKKEEISEDMKKRFAEFIRHIDFHRYQWEWSDRRNQQQQLQSVKEIGKNAKKLFLKICAANDGYVSDFLDWWQDSQSAKILPLSVFTNKQQLHSISGSFAWLHQTKMMTEKRSSRAELLIGLASIAEAAAWYQPSKTPSAQIGLQSQKKNELTFFVIRTYCQLMEIFGSSKYTLIANLSSLLHGANISNEQVKDIVKRAINRGDIPSSKSKKSPLI